jgi:hypothetical protein
MVRYLDLQVCRLHHLHRMTQEAQYESLEAEKQALRNHWRECSDDPPGLAVLAVLRAVRSLPPLTKSSAGAWARQGIVPLILATDARDYPKCDHAALEQIARQRGVKSIATFKSRLLAAVIPTLKSMARPG